MKANEILCSTIESCDAADLPNSPRLNSDNSEVLNAGPVLDLSPPVF